MDLSNQSTISQESISKMVLNIESNIKAELVPILSLVLHLLTNAPRAIQVLQGDIAKLEELDLRKFLVMIHELWFARLFRLKFQQQST